jgi:hypothetical protein
MKVNNKEDYIYIVLVKALTGLGKFARKFSKYEYTHASICLNENIDDFITFSRKKHYAPFDSGFMHETLDCYAYDKYESIKLKVFKVPVSLKNKKKIERYIETVSKDTEYIFNLYSMATMSLFHGFRIYKAHNCMSFVSKILELSKSVPMTKKYYKYNIQELDMLLSNYKYQEKNFYKTKVQNTNYMDKVSFISNIVMFLKLNAKLLYRIFSKRGLIKNEE